MRVSEECPDTESQHMHVVPKKGKTRSLFRGAWSVGFEPTSVSTTAF